MLTFQNIHHHDNYSLRSGLGSINDVIKKAKEFGQKYIGITNYNELSGWVNQYFSCVKNDITPILGVQMMISNYRVVYDGNSKNINKILFCGANKQKEMTIDEMTIDEKVAVGVNWHILLYAKNITGYYNLIKIHNDAHLNGVYEHPRTINYVLSQYSEGIACIIPSVNGEIINDIDNGRERFAIAKYKGYKKLFGEVYLELVIAEDDDYIEINNKVIEFCKKYSIPMVIGINSHYINKEDEDSFKALLSIYKQGDKKPEINMCPDMSYKNTEQVYEIFQRRFKNDIFTEEIFNQCLSNLNNFCNSIEKFDLDTSIKMPNYKDANKILEEKAWEGLRNRGHFDNPIYVQRLKYELDNVIRAGFADYFLFLEDICSFCRNNKIALGVGRGSGGGSLVLYSLHIFDVDPVKYNLLFERFLDASRLDEIINQGGHVTGGDLPDVDLDSASKESVVNYLRNKYGEGSVCLIGTNTNFSGANLLQDLGRVYDIDKDEILFVTKSMSDLDNNDIKNLSVDELMKKSSSLKILMEKYPQLKMPFNELRGNTVTYGVHASGVLVSNKNLTEMLPVRMSKDGISTCWIEGIESRELGQMGFVKMDFLEVKAMTFIEEIIKMINERHGFDRTRDDYLIDGYLNDKKAFEVANSGDLIGIWQLDSNVAKGVIRDMNGIRSFVDISTVNALMRPASLKNKFPKKFGDRRNGEESYTIPKCLEKYLSDTYGLPIFQEAAYHVAYNLAGFDNVKSYKFMKLLYKQKMTGDLIPYWKKLFIEGCKPKVDSGEIDSEYPEAIFNELLAFSGYGFNASHSIAYSMYSALDLFFKAHYRKEFTCCLLNHYNRTEEIENISAIKFLINYARKNGIRVFQPDINISDNKWIIDNNGIYEGLRFPLRDMMLLNQIDINNIIENRPYKNFDDFFEKIGNKFNEKKLEHLICSGAFNSFGDVTLILERWNQIKNKKDFNQLDFFDMMDDFASSTPVLTKEEQKQREEAMLNYVFEKTISERFDKYIEEFNVNAKKNNNMLLKTMDEVESGTARFRLVITKVDKIVNFTTKNGDKKCWILLTDGLNNAKMLVGEDDAKFTYKNYFKEGNILQIPVSVSEQDRTIYFFNKNSNKGELKIIEQS